MMMAYISVPGKRQLLYLAELEVLQSSQGTSFYTHHSDICMWLICCVTSVRGEDFFFLHLTLTYTRG